MVPVILVIATKEQSWDLKVCSGDTEQCTPPLNLLSLTEPFQTRFKITAGRPLDSSIPHPGACAITTTQPFSPPSFNFLYAFLAVTAFAIY